MTQRRAFRPFVSLTAICLIFLVAWLPAAHAAPTDTKADMAAIDSYVMEQMQALRIPGVALAIVRDQGDQPEVYLRGYGVANPDGTPVTAQTPFVLGSTTKSFTALAVMQLVDQGKLDLDRSVKDYLPWFSLKEAADSGPASQITLRHLLNHTSGIPQKTGEQYLAHNDASPDALERQVRALKDVQVARKAGEQFEYSNTNYQIAALVVQTVTGQAFEQYMQENILSPLGMTHSYTNIAAARQNGLATGYVYWFGVPLPAEYTPYDQGHFASGGLISCAEDVSHFLLMQMNEGRYGESVLVSAAGLKVMHTPALNDYGMGWAKGNLWLYHNGAVANFGSQFYVDPYRKIGVAVLFNANSELESDDLYLLAPSITRILTGTLPLPAGGSAEYRANLLTVVGLLVALAVWMVISAYWLHRWEKRMPLPRAAAVVWLVVPVLVEIGLAFYLLYRLDFNLANAFVFQPDLTVLLMVVILGLLGWATMRTVRSLRLMARPSA